MRLLSTAAACLFLSASIAAQEPRPENFSRFRAQAIDRLAQSAERLGLKGPEGRSLQANVSQVFSLPSDIRVIKAAEIAFSKDHHLTLTFSTNSTDVVLTEMKKMSEGTSLLTAFHTDLTLVLRGVASGADTASLRTISADSNTSSAFQEVLLTWDRVLLGMLERQLSK